MNDNDKAFRMGRQCGKDETNRIIALSKAAERIMGTSQIEMVWCDRCKCVALVCPSCGNMTCTSTNGKVDGKQCQICNEIYDIYDMMEKENKIPRESNGLRIIPDAFDLLFEEDK